MSARIVKAVGRPPGPRPRRRRGVPECRAKRVQSSSAAAWSASRRSIIWPRRAGRDVVLLERKELTSGSTWHAAGLLPLFNMSYSVGQIHKYSVRFYQDARGETGHECRLPQGLQHPARPHQGPLGRISCIMPASPRRSACTVNMLTPAAGEGDLAALRDRRASSAPSSIPTTATSSRPTSPRRWPRARATAAPRSTATPRSPPSRRAATASWLVTTDKGDITCEHVVSCTGNFARRTGAMVGLDVPVIPVEHQYIVTEPHPAIVGAQAAGPAGDGRAARERLLLVHARGGGRPAARPLRDRARRSAMSTGRPTTANTSCSRRTSSG